MNSATSFGQYFGSDYIKHFDLSYSKMYVKYKSYNGIPKKICILGITHYTGCLRENTHFHKCLALRLSVVPQTLATKNTHGASLLPENEAQQMNGF